MNTNNQRAVNAYIKEAESILEGVYNKELYNKAYEDYQSAFLIMKSKLGESHPDTLAMIEKFASKFLKSGMYKIAIELYNKIVEIKHTKFGTNSKETQDALENVASAALYPKRIYENVHDKYLDFHTAAYAYEKLIESYKDDNDKASTMEKLIRIYRRIGRTGRANNLQNELNQIERTDEYPQPPWGGKRRGKNTRRNHKRSKKTRRRRA